MSGAPSPVRYLALGDSYTIGTGASGPSRAWPSLVAAQLETALGRPVELTNLGVNGYTTSDVVEHELPHLGDAGWDCISILVGVNDVYRGYDESGYRARLVEIYDAIAAVADVLVIAVSLPDYSYTPGGRSSGDPAAILAGLQRFNAVAEAAARRRGFTWVDILEVSRERIGSPGWVAGDGLHPGDVQYRAWADHVWAEVRHAGIPARIRGSVP